MLEQRGVLSFLLTDYINLVPGQSCIVRSFDVSNGSTNCPETNITNNMDGRTGTNVQTGLVNQSRGEADRTEQLEQMWDMLIERMVGESAGQVWRLHHSHAH